MYLIEALQILYKNVYPYHLLPSYCSQVYRHSRRACTELLIKT